MAETVRVMDITLPFSERLPVWPGDTPVQIARATDFVTISDLRMSSHAGTHLDAPAHFIPQGRTVDQLSLESLIGPAWVVACASMACASTACASTACITADFLDRTGIPQGFERVLFKTTNSDRPWLDAGPDSGAAPFLTDFVALDPSAAEWLLARGVRLVGVDGPSVDPYESDFSVHRLLLGNNVIIVENLDLRAAEAGPYRLICLPLPYVGGDGAPVRALLETT